MDKKVTVKVTIESDSGSFTGGIKTAQTAVQGIKANLDELGRTSVSVQRSMLEASKAAVSALSQEAMAVSNLARERARLSGAFNIPRLAVAQTQMDQLRREVRPDVRQSSVGSAAVTGAVAAVAAESILRPAIEIKPPRTRSVAQQLGDVGYYNIRPYEEQGRLFAGEGGLQGMRRGMGFPAGGAGRRKGEVPPAESPFFPPDESEGGVPVEPSPTGPKPGGIGSRVLGGLRKAKEVVSSHLAAAAEVVNKARETAEQAMGGPSLSGTVAALGAMGVSKVVSKFKKTPQDVAEPPPFKPATFGPGFGPRPKIVLGGAEAHTRPEPPKKPDFDWGQMAGTAPSVPEATIEYAADVLSSKNKYLLKYVKEQLGEIFPGELQHILAEAKKRVSPERGKQYADVRKVIGNPYDRQAHVRQLRQDIAGTIQAQIQEEMNRELAKQNPTIPPVEVERQSEVAASLPETGAEADFDPAALEKQITSEKEKALSRMKNKELQAELKKLGRPVSGNKAALIARLMESTEFRLEKEEDDDIEKNAPFGPEHGIPNLPEPPKKEPAAAAPPAPPKKPPPPVTTAGQPPEDDDDARHFAAQKKAQEELAARKAQDPFGLKAALEAAKQQKAEEALVSEKAAQPEVGSAAHIAVLREEMGLRREMARAQMQARSDPQTIREELQLKREMGRQQKMEMRVGRELEFGKIGAGLMNVADTFEAVGKKSTIAFAAATTAIGLFVRAGSPVAFDTLTGNFKLLAGTIGNQFIPYIITAADWLGKARGWVNSLSEETKGSIAKWTLYGVVALGAGTALGRIAPIARVAGLAMGFIFRHPYAASFMGIAGAAVFLADKLGILQPILQGLGGIGQHIGESLGQLSQGQIATATTLGFLGMAAAPAIGRLVAMRQATLASARNLSVLGIGATSTGSALSRFGSTIGNVGLGLAGFLSAHPWIMFGTIVVGTLASMTNGFGLFGSKVKEVNHDLQNTVNALHNIDIGRNIVRDVRAERQGNQQPSEVAQRQRLEQIREVIGEHFYTRLISMGRTPARERLLQGRIAEWQAVMPTPQQLQQMATRQEQMRIGFSQMNLQLGGEQFNRLSFESTPLLRLLQGVSSQSIASMLIGPHLTAFNRGLAQTRRDVGEPGEEFRQLYATQQLQRQVREGLRQRLGREPTAAERFEELAKTLTGRAEGQRSAAMVEMLRAFQAINPGAAPLTAPMRPVAAAGLAGAVGMGFGPFPGIAAMAPTGINQERLTRTDRLIGQLPEEMRSTARALLFMDMQPRQVEIDALHDLVQNESIRSEGAQELLAVNLDGFRRVVMAIERLYAMQNQGGAQIVGGIGMDGVFNWAFGGK